MGLATSVICGSIWWILPPLTLMSLFMGLGADWNATAAVAMLLSLAGHIMFGAILGVVFVWQRERVLAYPAASPH